MQPLSEILSIQNVAIKLAKRVICPNSPEYIFTKEPVVKGFTISGTSELELKGNTSEKVQQARESVRLAKIAQDLTTKLQELVKSKQLHPRSPLTGGLDNENHGEQTHVNVIEAELTLTEHFDIQFANPSAIPAKIFKPKAPDKEQSHQLTANVPDISPSEGVYRKSANIKRKLNRNELDPAIDEAIKQAGNMELADVFLKLKELALNSFAPFTGAVDGDSLCYTNSNDKPDKLSKNALGKRLKNRRDNFV